MAALKYKVCALSVLLKNLKTWGAQKMTEKLTFTAKEAAVAIGINYVTLLQLAKRKDFPAVWIGRRVVIPREGLSRWLAESHRYGGSV